MTHRCAHHHCRCEIPTDARYCSDTCRESAEAAEPAAAEAFDMSVCTCGHADCARRGERDRPHTGKGSAASAGTVPGG